MPAGCDFICRNNECEQSGKGFVITAPWPMAKIDKVLKSRRVSELPDHQKQLSEIKDSGREYTCLTLPNVDNITTDQYRVQFWSDKAQCIWQYEVKKEGKVEDAISKAIENGEIPQKCPKTKSKMLSFKEVSKKGIDCPFCKDKMIQNRWFTNE